MSKSGGDIWKRKQNMPLKQCSKRLNHLHTSGLKTCTPISHNPVFPFIGYFMGAFISWLFCGRVYRYKCKAMAKNLKLSLVILLIKMSVEVSASMYDISRGDIDMYSRNIPKAKHAKKCGNNYCCGESTTFIYDIGAQTGNCVKNTDVLLQSG